MSVGSKEGMAPYPGATAVLLRVLSPGAVKSVHLALLLIGGPVMSAPEYDIQWRDQFGNYRNYTPQQSLAVIEMCQRGDG